MDVFDEVKSQKIECNLIFFNENRFTNYLIHELNPFIEDDWYIIVNVSYIVNEFTAFGRVNKKRKFSTIEERKQCRLSFIGIDEKLSTIKINVYNTLAMKVDNEIIQIDKIGSKIRISGGKIVLRDKYNRKNPNLKIALESEYKIECFSESKCLISKISE